METLDIQATLRETTGKSTSATVRRQGLVPAVLYGGDGPQVHCTVSAGDLRKALRTPRRRNVVLRLVGIEGEPLAMVKDLQVHPVNDRILHVDFLRVAADRPVVVEVPTRIVGEAPGVVQQGGAVDRPLRNLRISVTPDRIPLDIEVSIDGLYVGQRVAAGQIPLPEGCTLVTGGDVSVAVIQATRATRLMGEQARSVEEEEAAEA